MAEQETRQKPPSHLRLIQEDSLLTSCIADPSLIDEHLWKFLAERPLTKFPESDSFRHLFKHRDSVAEYLFVLLDSTKSAVTPELHWGGDPTCSPVYYKSNLVYASMLGRGLSISWAICNRIGHNIKEGSDAIYSAWPWPVASETVKQTESYASDIKEICSRFWEAARVMFIKALFTGEPTPGDRYAAAILFLTASVAIREGMSENNTNTGAASAVPKFEGRGKAWLWYDGKINPANEDVRWGWAELLGELAKTRDLPTENTDGAKMRQQINEANQEAQRKRKEWQESKQGSEDTQGEKKDFGFVRYPNDTGEYVPIEVLQAFKQARKHTGLDMESSGTASSVGAESSNPQEQSAQSLTTDITSKDLLSMEPFASNFYSVSDGVLDG